MTSETCVPTNMLIFGRERRKRRGKGQANAQVSFEAAKRAPIGYYYPCKYTLLIRWHLLFSNFPQLVHEEFGPAFARMGNFAALKAKLQEAGYDGDGDLVVGAVISPGVIVHLTIADMRIDYDAALLIVQSSEARQYGDLVSRTKLFIKDVQQLCIASHS